MFPLAASVERQASHRLHRVPLHQVRHPCPCPGYLHSRNRVGFMAHEKNNPLTSRASNGCTPIRCNFYLVGFSLVRPVLPLLRSERSSFSRSISQFLAGILNRSLDPRRLSLVGFRRIRGHHPAGSDTPIAHVQHIERTACPQSVVRGLSG